MLNFVRYQKVSQLKEFKTSEVKVCEHTQDSILVENWDCYRLCPWSSFAMSDPQKQDIPEVSADWLSQHLKKALADSKRELRLLAAAYAELAAGAASRGAEVQQISL